MVEALKKLDRKFLIIVGIIIGLPILLIIFLAIIQGCSNSKMSYENYEKKMITAAEKYMTKEGFLPTEEGQVEIVDLTDLVDNKYIKSPQRAIKDDSCVGNVSVRRNGASIETTGGGFLNYIVSLKCSNYSTETMVKRITSELVTSGSGLYQVGNEYIFKGNKVNNYIKFYGHDYRIMSIDGDGIMRLIRSQAEPTSKFWDNKYNKEVDKNYGKTIYSDSAILSVLIADYKNPKKIMKKAKVHVVAYDSCIGKRAIDDYSISKDLDCSEILTNQVISTVNVSDFALASADNDCTSIVSKSCRNYNYLSSILYTGWTMNSVSNNDYEAYYISDGIVLHKNANLYNQYNIVIYVDGNELYTKGTGTIDNPYVME